MVLLMGICTRFGDANVYVFHYLRAGCLYSCIVLYLRLCVYVPLSLSLSISSTVFVCVFNKFQN